MKDSCGTVGSIYTNATIAVASGDLSTVSLDLPIGAVFNNRGYARWHESVSAFTKNLRTEDIQCPTWGLGNATEDPRQQYMFTVGAPFNPIIDPPQALLGLDPAWKACSHFRKTGTGGHVLYEIFDPPRTLEPAQDMVPPSPTPVSSSAGPEAKGALPGDIPKPKLPEQTWTPAKVTADHSTNPDNQGASSDTAQETKPDSHNGDPKKDPVPDADADQNHDSVEV